jgi:hypothetical protein
MLATLLIAALALLAAIGLRELLEVSLGTRPARDLRID